MRPLLTPCQKKHIFAGQGPFLALLKITPNKTLRTPYPAVCNGRLVYLILQFVSHSGISKIF